MALRLNLLVIALLVVAGGIAVWLWPDEDDVDEYTKQFELDGGSQIVLEGELPARSALPIDYYYDVPIARAQELLGYRLLRTPGGGHAGTVEIAQDGSGGRFVSTPASATLVQAPAPFVCVTDRFSEELIGGRSVTFSRGYYHQFQCGVFREDHLLVFPNVFDRESMVTASLRTGEMSDGQPIVAVVSTFSFEDDGLEELRRVIAGLSFED